jgi:hypothetical protein
MAAFWLMLLCSVVGGYHCFSPEDGGDWFLQNVDSYLPDYIAS